MRAPFRWFGSKGTLAPAIVAALPPHEHYVEVFAGSAAVLFAKARSPLETINDIDGRVVNFLRVLRDQPDEFLHALELTPYARAEYLEDRSDASPGIEGARRFAVTCMQSMGAPGRGWSYNTEGRGKAISANRAAQWARYPDRLAGLVQRLRGVQIESLDWRDVLERYDRPGVVLFLDPPYHPDTRTDKSTYAHEMIHDDHDELIARLGQLDHAEAVVTHYDHPLYQRLDAAGWVRREVDGGIDAGLGSSRIEVIWSSSANEPTLFGAVS